MAIYNMRIGGGDVQWNNARLHIYAPEGSIVVISKGAISKTLQEHTVSGADSEYVENITLADYGTWTITATLGIDTATDTILIESNIEYFFKVFYGFKFKYTGDYSITEGNYEVVGDVIKISSKDFTMELLTSGTLTPIVPPDSVDIHCVGGGNGRGNAGGAGGYTNSSFDNEMYADQSYSIVVGAGGSGSAQGGTSSFGNLLTAAGALSGSSTGTWNGTSGGSGGGAYGHDYGAGGGGSNGGDGGSSAGSGGKGQIARPGPNGETGNTYDFHDTSLTLRAGGGGGSYGYDWIRGNTSGGAGGGGNSWSSGATNYGGGGGAMAATSGGSGIVIFRNHR